LRTAGIALIEVRTGMRCRKSTLILSLWGCVSNWGLGKVMP